MKQEQEFKTLVENLPDIIARFDRELRCIYINPAVTEATGLTPEDFLNGTDAALNMPQKATAEWFKTLRRVFDTGQETVLEQEFETPDGLRYYQSRLLPEFDSDGTVSSVLSIGRDITAQKRTEATLREQSERYRKLIEISPDAITVTDAEANILLCNQQAATMYGYDDTAEILGKNTFELIAPEEHKRAMASLTKMIAEGHTKNNVYTLLKKNGTRFIAEISASVLTDSAGQPQGFVAISRDVTQRQRAKARLRILESAVQQANEAMLITTAELDPPGPQILFANPAFTAITGYEIEEVIGRTPRILQGPKTERAVLDRLRADLSQGRTFQGETINYRKDGSEFYNEWQVAPIRNEKGITTHYIGIQRDVTERKQAEQELQRANRLLRATFSSINQAVLVIDAPTRTIKVANPAVEQIFGYSQADVVGRTTEFLHVDPAHSGRFAEEGDPFLERDGVFRTEYPMRRKSGQIFYAEITVTPIDDAEGWLKGVVSVIDDITERKSMEDELRRRNQELALINQITGAAGTELEPDRVIETACRELGRFFKVPLATVALLHEDNEAAEIVAEYRTSEAEPTLLNTIIPVETSPILKEMLSQGSPLMVSDIRNDRFLAGRADPLLADEVISALSLPLVIDGAVAGTILLVAEEQRQFASEEITLAWSVADQVAAVLGRARLRQTQQLLSTAVEEAGESILITDPQGTILYVNPAFERTLGYSQAEVLGRNIGFLRSGQHEPEFYDELWATIRAGKSWQGRIINKKKDGTLFTQDVTISPVRDQSGTIIYYVEIKRDMTRELELEAQYRQAQKMEAIGRLTGGIAHDFNNLLTAINGFAELIQMRLPPDDPQQRAAALILKSGRSAVALIRQLLAFSRKQALEPKVLDLNRIIADLDKMLRRIISEDIELKTILGPELWPVKVDLAQIEQVIVNLVVNARDAMPEGGLLTIETGNVLLDEAYVSQHLAAEPGEHVLLSVSDNGIGMSQEIQEHIFEPFFTTKEEDKGTGLGLATVFGIVKQSGGHIWFYSEVGQGTTFQLYLPRAREDTDTLPRADETAELPTGNEAILLVEDSEDVRHVMRPVLQGQGYTVLEVAHGQQAIELSERYLGPIDLLLTDVVLPGMNGRQLSEQLRESRPDLKVLFMSGYTGEAVARHGIVDSEMPFIQKPFSAMALARKIREVLNDKNGASDR